MEEVSSITGKGREGQLYEMSQKQGVGSYIYIHIYKEVPNTWYKLGHEGDGYIKVTANNMATLFSAIPPAINPNLNSEFYIEWYSNDTARPKRNSEYITFGNQTAHDPTLHTRQERETWWRGSM
jgi:hypothetical protein